MQVPTGTRPAAGAITAPAVGMVVVTPSRPVAASPRTAPTAALLSAPTGAPGGASAQDDGFSAQDTQTPTADRPSTVKLTQTVFAVRSHVP